MPHHFWSRKRKKKKSGKYGEKIDNYCSIVFISTVTFQEHLKSIYYLFGNVTNSDTGLEFIKQCL